MIDERGLRALPIADQVALFLAQAELAEPGRLVRPADFVPTVPRIPGILAPAPTPGRIDPAVRDRVNACTDRGGVLPISMQADCGCAGKELSECRRGLGTIAGRVTLRDCLACMRD